MLTLDETLDTLDTLDDTLDTLDELSCAIRN
jgi:hypothetical protein